MKSLAVAAVWLVAVAAAAQPVQTAFGVAGEPSQATRTVTVDMTDDMRFTPATLDVRLGETVRFMLANKGATMHEMVLGTPKDIAQHAAMMARMPGAEHAGHMEHMQHGAPSMAHVQPGATGEIVWRFNRAGTFGFACLVPGHFEAGMKGVVTVR